MYTPRSYRQFKSFIGELTATNAGVHAVLLEYEATYGENADKALTDTALKHKIILNSVTASDIINNQSRLSLVSILSGFDRYFSEIENECKSLGMHWIKPEKTSPIKVLKLNVTKGLSLTPNSLEILKVIEYYRSIRNWVAHPSLKNKIISIDSFESTQKEIKSVRTLYNFKTAPNSFDAICFHDVKLLSKLLLDALKEISTKIKPTDIQLMSSIPKKFLFRDSAKTKKIKRAAKYLESEYGISSMEAIRITETNYGVLA